MRNFLNTNFDISKIVIAIHVPAGSGVAVHVNRPSHGLAIHLEGRKIYRFEGNKSIVVQKNDIIYVKKWLLKIVMICIEKEKLVMR